MCLLQMSCFCFVKVSYRAEQTRSLVGWAINIDGLLACAPMADPLTSCVWSGPQILIVGRHTGPT
jgi:hypothetical protein